MLKQSQEYDRKFKALIILEEFIKIKDRNSGAFVLGFRSVF